VPDEGTASFVNVVQPVLSGWAGAALSGAAGAWRWLAGGADAAANDATPPAEALPVKQGAPAAAPVAPLPAKQAAPPRTDAAASALDRPSAGEEAQDAGVTASVQASVLGPLHTWTTGADHEHPVGARSWEPDGDGETERPAPKKSKRKKKKRGPKAAPAEPAPDEIELANTHELEDMDAEVTDADKTGATASERHTQELAGLAVDDSVIKYTSPLNVLKDAYGQSCY
jgi:hypothetical protein